MITKPVLGLMAASVAIAGMVGYMVGKSSLSGNPGSNVSSDRGTSSTSGFQAGFDENGSVQGASTLSSTRMSLGKVSNTSWHQFKGPYTAESWMAIRQAILATPLEQVEDTLAKLAELPMSQERMRLQREVLSMWATRDPVAAMGFADGIEMRDERRGAREDILRVWAGREPKLAFDWLAAQKGVMPEGEYNRIIDDAVRGYADLNLSEAINFFNTLSTTLERRQNDYGINEIVESMIQQGEVANAASYINQLTDERLRNEASEELMSELAKVDLNQAVELLSQFQGSPAYVKMQEELVEEWVENDPAQAAAYVSSSVEVGDGFAAIASEVVQNWDDISAASEWLAQYEPSPELDRPTLALVYRASREDPEGALSWAGTVTDRLIQRRAVSVVASYWKASDADGMNRYLAQNNYLSPEMLKVIQSTPARPSSSRGR